MSENENPTPETESDITDSGTDASTESDELAEGCLLYTSDAADE